MTASVAARAWPTLLDRYVGGELAAAVGFGLAVFGALLVGNEFFYLGRLLLDRGIPTGALLELLAYRTPYVLFFCVPMATLLGTILAYGRLRETRELEAMQTGGVSLGRIALPAVALGAVASVVTFWVGEVLVPLAAQRYVEALPRVGASALRTSVRHGVLFRERTPDGAVLVVAADRLDLDAGTLEGVTVQEQRGGRVVRVVEAQRARWTQEGWWFERGRMVSVEEGAVLSEFERMLLRIPRTPAEIAPPARSSGEMSTWEIRAELERRRRSGEPTRGLEVDWHGKFALPGSALAFAVLGVGLAVARKEAGRRGMGFGLAVVAILAYYVLITATTLLGQAGRLPPWLAAWLPDLSAAGCGVWILWRHR
ncbi:MAG: LptF/LptG family permease [Armatimonadota bacterium]|nr:LptF/LptG family permease [Armatimonadota bacterium]MDW8156039.1 LptF/LptG family permease [Armatimonadota bacterium]